MPYNRTSQLINIAKATTYSKALPTYSKLKAINNQDPKPGNTTETVSGNLLSPRCHQVDKIMLLYTSTMSQTISQAVTKLT